MEWSIQEMESFLQFPVIGSKNFFNKRFLVQSNDPKKISHSVQRFQNGFHKQEMELSKQGMELFLPFSVIVSKNFFYKRSLIWSNHSKIVFRNRKWNHLNRKWNHFSLLQALDQNTSLTKDSLFSPMIPKWFL